MNTPKLETNRLILRKFNENDLKSNALDNISIKIDLPSLDKRGLVERLEIVQECFKNEARKIDKSFVVEPETLECLLLYHCKNNIKQLINDISSACSHAFLKNLDNDSNVYVYLDDFPIYVKKGFIFYKEKDIELNKIISHDFLYYYSKDTIEKVKIKESNYTVYEHLEKQGTRKTDTSLLLKNRYEQLISYYRQYIDKEKIDELTIGKYVSQDIIVREHDCGTNDGIIIYDIKDGNQVIEKMQERLLGRYAVDDVYDPNTNELIVDNNTMITESIAEKIVSAGIEKLKVRSALGCRTKHGVCQKCYGMGLARRDLVSIGEAVGIIAAQSIGEPGTQLTMRTIHSGGVAGVADITQGLPRVEELFEARKPKGVAVITEIAGKVKIKETKKKKEVIVTSKDDSRTYTIPFGAKMKVKDGDLVEIGDALIEGSINPNEILAIKGPEGVYEYLISEVQKVYRNQGVDINDKHIEVIGRQMLKKVKVADNGDTKLAPGSLVDMYDFEEANEEAKEAGLRQAEGKRVLLGITKASLATDSFLSAASFQETTRVLTDAAIKGKTDDLLGLKENVIIGKLIPAGTGMQVYQDTKISTENELEETADVENM